MGTGFSISEWREQLICNQQVIGSTPVPGSNHMQVFCVRYQGKRPPSDSLRCHSLSYVISHYFVPFVTPVWPRCGPRKPGPSVLMVASTHHDRTTMEMNGTELQTI